MPSIYRNLYLCLLFIVNKKIQLIHTKCNKLVRIFIEINMLLALFKNVCSYAYFSILNRGYIQYLCPVSILEINHVFRDIFTEILCISYFKFRIEIDIFMHVTYFSNIFYYTIMVDGKKKLGKFRSGKASVIRKRKTFT